MTRALEVISGMVAHGQALGEPEVLALWQSTDLVSLGMLADDARRRRHGDITTYLRVTDVGADEIASAEVQDAGELRYLAGQGGLRPRLAELRRLVARAGATPVTAGILDDLLTEVGAIEALPGLLAELRDTGIHGLVAARVDRLADEERAVTAVLEAGLAIARVTVQAPPEEAWRLLDRVNRLQAATGAVRAFAPLAWRPSVPQATTGYQDTKLIALARLVLDRVPSIQVDWAAHGPKLAQVALLFGADDLDAVTAQGAGDLGRRRAPLEEVRRNIRAASLTPVERDGRFRSLEP
jgi:aminodeoxyfutalosine synthase